MAEQPRKRLKREDRRDIILRHAIDVFGTLGYHNATTSELAKAAGVSEALLYQHFPSKQALLVACIEALGDEIYEGLQEILVGVDDPVATFRRLNEQLTAFVSSNRETSRFGLVILAELEDGEIHAATRRIVERTVELLARALRRGQQRHALREDVDPEVVSWFLIGLYQLFALLQRLDLLDRVHPDALQDLIRPFLAEQ